MISNSKGITLIELLLALTASFVLIGLLYGILQMGMKSFNSDVRSNDLQTDANIVLSTITNEFYHEQCAPFGQTLLPNNGIIYLYDGKTPISNSLFNYTGTITCTNDDYLAVDLKATYKNQAQDIKTTLYYPWEVNH